MSSLISKQNDILNRFSHPLLQITTPPELTTGLSTAKIEGNETNHPALSSSAQDSNFSSPIISPTRERLVLAADVEDSLRTHTPAALRHIYRQFTGGTRHMPGSLRNRETMIDSYFNVNRLSKPELITLSELSSAYVVPEKSANITERKKFD